MFVMEIGDLACMALSVIRSDPLPRPTSAQPRTHISVPAENTECQTACEHKQVGMPDFREVRESALSDPDLAVLWLHLFNDSNP